MSDFNFSFGADSEDLNMQFGSGIPGPKGDPGEDGKSVTGATINQNYELILTVGDDTTINAGVLPRGQKGETGNPGPTGAKIVSTELYSSGDDGNTYKQTFDNGTECFFVAPKGAKGNTGDQGGQGVPGTMGTTFTPSVSAEGVISWTNDGGKSNPASRSIKGPKGDRGSDGIGIPGRDGRDGLTTSITMNGETKTQVNGNIDLGTVVTDLSSYYTKTQTESLVNQKSTVSVSASGTSTSEVEYITIDGVEKKIKSGDEAIWGNITGTLSNQTDLNTALGSKANASDVYTKTEADSLLANKVNTTSLDLTTTNKNVILAINELDSDKVDVVSGKGLSTNDYDNTEKQKVADAYADKHTHSNMSILNNIGSDANGLYWED